MIKYLTFPERPEAITYVPLPDGRADIWLRKNIREFSAVEDEEGETVTVELYAYDEAYMRAAVTLEQIEADFDGCFELAAAWKQVGDAAAQPTEEERIAALERANAALSEQLCDAQLALCELYELMIGG